MHILNSFLCYFNNILSGLIFLPLLTYFHCPVPSPRISSQCSEDTSLCLLTELGLFFHLRIPSSTIKIEWKDCTLILNTKLLLSFRNSCLPYFLILLGILMIGFLTFFFYFFQPPLWLKVVVSTFVYSLSAEPFLSDGKNWSFYCAEEIDCQCHIWKSSDDNFGLRELTIRKFEWNFLIFSYSASFSVAQKIKISSILYTILNSLLSFLLRLFSPVS